MPRSKDRQVKPESYGDRIEEVLNFGKYRRSVMALKWTMWELQRLVSAEQGEEL